MFWEHVDWVRFPAARQGGNLQGSSHILFSAENIRDPASDRRPPALESEYCQILAQQPERSEG